MSKVSVIIPVYKTEAYLPECLDSVLSQTLGDLEVICIDDCSPDRSGEILDGYARRDGRVQVIHLPENRRQGYGRNRGLERATGEYVYFLDSDDMIEPQALEELTELADRDGLDAVFFDSRNIFESEEVKRIYNPMLTLRKGTYRNEVYIGADLLDDFILQNEWTCYPQRILWRREFIVEEGIRYPENCEHEDEFFAYAGILAAKRARYVPKQYFILRTRADSVMTSGYAPKNFHGYLMNYFYMNRFISERNIDTKGAHLNISRMFERMLTLYAVLKDHCDIGEVFVKEPDRTIYECFLSYLRAEDEMMAIDPEVMDVIRQYRIVYIYGAKLTGQRFCAKLQRQKDVLIGGFLVKDMEDIPEIVMGRSVRCIDDVEIPEDAIVVAAIKVMFWEETKEMLEKRGIRCIFLRKL